jgi:hypothetical protein
MVRLQSRRQEAIEMLTPKVTEIRMVPLHEREARLVRRSLLAVPEAPRPDNRPDPRDPLRTITPRDLR